jgi:hypothetical protein
MKINKTSTFKYFLALVCFVVFTQWQGIPVAMSQELIEPISKANLLSAIKLNRREKNPLKKMTVAGYMRLINRYGVDFPLTAETEQEVRGAGAYFSATELDKLLTAVRSNYRPAEPTEAEMKEAVLSTIEERGGQRTSDGAIEAKNIIAGVRIKIAKFEKLRCAPPTYGPGYFCTYNVSLPVTIFSNDGTELGRRQIEAWNFLIGWFSNGNNITERLTSKFVWTKDRWVMSVE